ncbi:AAA-ATPase [Arthrobacter phage Sonali]|uniref:AAA-ATPase n=1 Tax=Arthrobacter phage Sonali TaxID=2510495 RepID=A0A411CQF4_9CAUD|nr:AAA-ATPase [Arthrobacter phage Sonali]QAY16155.1 AAA-ATPase [Arthrobacter phage Sonali]
MGRKIVNLQAENIMRLKAVEITPEGSVVLVGGNNGEGKSSTLNAMWLALGGGAASKSIARPVRDGAEEAVVRLDLGDLIVTRKWKGSKTSLTVESKDGAKYSSPQSILDGLVGKLAFDPLEFAQYAPAKQREILMSLVELPFDPAELDANRKSIFDSRTDINRKVKELEGQVKGFYPIPAGTPDQEVSVAELLKEYRAAQDANARTEQIARDVHNNELLVQDLRMKLAQAEADLEGNRAALAACPPRMDLGAIQDKIDNAENINANVREAQAQTDVRHQLKVHQNKAEELTGRITQLDMTKADMLASAVYPVTGLGFDDDGVTYNGVPFKQASSAEQLRVSTAMGMALNPDLRVMHIRDGSLLDEKNLDLIARMADANDFQVWIERVGKGDQGAVIIEDGQVSSEGQVAA